MPINFINSLFGYWPNALSIISPVAVRASLAVDFAVPWPGNIIVKAGANLVMKGVLPGMFFNEERRAWKQSNPDPDIFEYQTWFGYRIFTKGQVAAAMLSLGFDLIKYGFYRNEYYNTGFDNISYCLIFMGVSVAAFKEYYYRPPLNDEVALREKLGIDLKRGLSKAFQQISTVAQTSISSLEIEEVFQGLLPSIVVKNAVDSIGLTPAEAEKPSSKLAIHTLAFALLMQSPEILRKALDLSDTMRTKAILQTTLNIKLALSDTSNVNLQQNSEQVSTPDYSSSSTEVQIDEFSIGVGEVLDKAIKNGLSNNSNRAYELEVVIHKQTIEEQKNIKKASVALLIATALAISDPLLLKATANITEKETIKAILLHAASPAEMASIRAELATSTIFQQPDRDMMVNLMADEVNGFTPRLI